MVIIRLKDTMMINMLKLIHNILRIASQVSYVAPTSLGDVYTLLIRNYFHCLLESADNVTCIAPTRG